jgi:hypothetical protein
MAVKRYDGSAWQTVAGLGAQGAAATSSTITTWVKTAAGGETSLSGNDDNSQSLSYTIGQELVFINGSLQKRGSDYTATSGTSINGLTALAANDVVTVWSNNAFSVTNAISNTIVDAKGDVLVGTAADTPGRLAVGTDGQVLTAASTTGTGLAWTTISAASGPAFRATRGATNQTLTSGAYVKLQYDVETFDTDSCYDPTTNYRFTPNKAGYYFVYLGAYFYANSGSSVILRLYKNGSVYLPNVWGSGNLGPQYASPTGSSFVYMNGSTDYLEAYGYHGGTSPGFGTDGELAQFMAFWVRS